MKVLGVVGSKRKTGNTSYLVQQALNAIKSENVETELIFLGDYNISGCTGCEGCKDTYKCVIKDDMQKIYPLIINSDAIILGSPTYFYNITSDMKAFIERLYCFEVFSKNDRSVWLGVNEALGGKYAAVIAVCEQDNEEDMGFTAEAMKKPLEALGYRVLSTVKIFNMFKKGEVLEDSDVLEQVKIAAQKLERTFRLRKETEEKFKTHIDDSGAESGVFPCL